MPNPVDAAEPRARVTREGFLQEAAKCCWVRPRGLRRAQPYPGHVQDSPCRVHPELSLTSPHIPPESPQRPQEVEILAPKSERRSKLLP